MFLNQDQLYEMNFKHLGKGVLISDKVSIYGANRIEIGDNVRIDDYCVLSAGNGGIKIGNNVHIAVFCSLIGQDTITLKDFSGLSSRVSIYSSTDDYSGEFLTNPTVDSKYTNVFNGKVTLGKHVIVGAGTVILPNVELHDYSAVAALSLVTKDVDSFKIVGGVPANILKERKNNLIHLECEYLKNLK
jgi:acetyltransferase-like isoleucine patch superfamily enzyme